MTQISAISRQDVLIILERLVGFDTTSRLSNLALIDWVEGVLAPLGATCVRLPDPTGQKANLWARIGPDVAGGIVLSGHTDVVPTDGQAWDTDPFTLTLRGDKVFGRGTSDMKSFIALALAFADRFAREGLARPVHFAFSYDEEVGCLGAPAMIDEIVRRGPAPSAVLVGEPTCWGVVTAHKGISTFYVEALGREAHSSQTQLGASAIMAILPVLEEINRQAQRAASRPPATTLPFTPAHTTLTIGEIHGGTAVNILAKSCRFVFDLRCPPGEEAEDYLGPIRHAVERADAAIKALAPEAGVTLVRRSGAPPLCPEMDGMAERLARRLTGDNQSRVAAYAAEAGQFQTAGLSTVICGPGDIAQAHQPNEFIALSELDRGIDVFEGLLAELKRAL